MKVVIVFSPRFFSLFGLTICLAAMPILATSADITMSEISICKEMNSLAGDGYDHLEAQRFSEAKAAFEKQIALVPQAPEGYYNLACALSKAGEKAEAFKALNQAFMHGFADLNRLSHDTDLGSLKDDPAFQELLAKVATRNQELKDQIGKGIPQGEILEDIQNLEALEAWAKASREIIGKNRQLWDADSLLAYRIGQEARYLATKDALSQNDPDYSAPLERIRLMSSFLPTYFPWSGLSDAILSSVEKALATGNDKVKQEAAYYGGVAVYQKTMPRSEEDPEFSSTLAKAEEYLKQVGSESEKSGTAKAWLLNMGLLKSGGQPTDSWRKSVVAFMEQNKDDKQALATAGGFFRDEMVAAIWPIPLEGVDIDGNAVRLTDYRDKVVLIDFWATWCGPCKAELPGLKKVYEAYHDQGFEIVSISVDYIKSTSQDAYRRWVQGRGMAWRHIYDELDWTSPLVKAYMVDLYGIPSPFLIGPDGELAATGSALRGENLEETVKKVLAKRKS